MVVHSSLEDAGNVERRALQSGKMPEEGPSRKIGFYGYNQLSGRKEKKAEKQTDPLSVLVKINRGCF